jgi:hypothetical protein
MAWPAWDEQVLVGFECQLMLIGAVDAALEWRGSGEADRASRILA